MPYLHGTDVSVTAESTTKIQQPVLTGVGAIVTADDADAIFAEGEAVLLPDFSSETLAKTGTTGTFKSVFNTLQSQGYTPQVVVVRVAENADEAAIVAAIETLKTHSNHFGFDIKLIMAPGLETSTAIINKLESAAVAMGASAKAALTMCADYDAVVTERAKYDLKATELLWPVTHFDNGEMVHVSALAIAARIMTDETHNIAASMSSKKLNGGIDALSMPVDHGSEDSLANKLNAIQVSTVIRRSASDFCIFGARTTSTNENYRYEMWGRVSNLIKTMIKEGFKTYLDGTVTPEAIIASEELIKTDTIDFVKREGLASGGFFKFNSEKTTADTLKDGKVLYEYGFGPVPIFEQIRVEGDIMLSYMDQIILDTQAA